MSRKDYEKINVDRFAEQVKEAIDLFVYSMEMLKTSSYSFPEWYEMFGIWLEVGTVEEEMWYVHV